MPCLDPSNVEGENLLINEIGAKSSQVCPTIKKCDKTKLPPFDSRYRELEGLSITLYDLYNENGLDSYQNALKNYKSDFDERKSEILKPFVRPIIPFLDDCSTAIR